MQIVSWFLIIYGVLALVHIFGQILFAYLNYCKDSADEIIPDYDSPVSVIVPSYNEDPKVLNNSIKSILEQNMKNLELIVIDDHSENFDELYRKVYRKYENDIRVKMIYSKRNQGKRDSQKMGFDIANGKFIITIDSDTVFHDSNSIANLISRFSDPEIGAVTGDVRVENDRKNFLTRLIGYRYWNAFNQERAAQSYFKSVACCSGPFSAYRKSIIDNVKDEYVNEMFMGEKCTFGDDRHLTNLVLHEGYKVVYEYRALAYTYVPSTIKKYVKQQVRWNKSFYRELLWTIKNVHNQSWYLYFDMFSQLVLPFMLLIAIVTMIVQCVLTASLYLFWKYVIVLIIIAVIRSLYGIIRTSDIGFLMFILYGFIHILFMIPVRLYALCTINHTHWGTR